MDRTTFEGLVKDALTNLYDAAALESHPQLFSVFKPPAGFPAGKIEYLRQTMANAIDQLRPDRKDGSLNSPEFRPYLILHKRYIEGVGMQDLANQLTISDRQLRRDHHRGLQALTVLLWNQLYPEQPAEWDETEPAEETPQQFEIHAETINPQEIILGVYCMLQERLEEESAAVDLHFDQPVISVTSDRVILRQILISLFNEALRLHEANPILVHVKPEGPVVEVSFDVPAGKAAPSRKGGGEEGLEIVRLWSERINARFEETTAELDGRQVIRRLLRLPRSDQKIILVVDDQAPAVNLFKRYLSHTPLNIVGINHADQVLPMARQLCPAAITLDVMMPKVDGWEILQMLKLDEETRQIPVIICSAWEEPELSRSLRAADFLKKPVTQKNLLEALERLGLLEP